jgi:hypothetical protein
MNTLLKIGIILLILIIIGIVGYYFLLKAKSLKKEIPLKVTPSIPSKKAKPEKIGIKEGDWVKYSVVQMVVPGKTQLEDWIKVEIKKIEGNKVTEFITKHYKNGTTENETRTIDISKELDFVTSPNLNVGDSREGLPPMGTLTVKKILEKSYKNVTREVAYMQKVEKNRTLNSWYDRKTGFLLEQKYELPDFGVKVHFILESTNLW